jgi:hypothetical protein
MKVICIDDTTLSGKTLRGLTINKIYDAVQKSGSGSNSVFEITDDDGYIMMYNNTILMPLDKWRQIQLKELGI